MWHDVGLQELLSEDWKKFLIKTFKTYHTVEDFKFETIKDYQLEVFHIECNFDLWDFTIWQVSLFSLHLLERFWCKEVRVMLSMIRKQKYKVCALCCRIIGL